MQALFSGFREFFPVCRNGRAAMLGTRVCLTGRRLFFCVVALLPDRDLHRRTRQAEDRTDLIFEIPLI